MQLPNVNGFFLHQPDTNSPLTETLAETDKMVKEGLIKEIGMSNYSALELQRTLDICKEKGLTPPTQFQALYNPLNRKIEKELIPILRSAGIRLVAYNPLAAGMLTGKHKAGQEVAAGRFKDNPNYLGRFYKDDCFAGLSMIQEACDTVGITLLQATFSWLMHHSALQEGDAILLGASKVEHLEANIKAAHESTPLPEEVLAAFEKAWAGCEEEAFPFWRSYSLDQPGREDLDPGAAYVVKK